MDAGGKGLEVREWGKTTSTTDNSVRLTTLRAVKLKNKQRNGG